MKSRVLIDGRILDVTVRRQALETSFEVDGEPVVASIVEVEPDIYHVLLDGRSVEVRVSGDRYQAQGHTMTVNLQDPRAYTAGHSAASLEGRHSLVSPMPGKVVRVLVSEGEQVERDQGVIVVEAMKMQNELKAPKAGKITQLAAKQGQAVEPGEVLLVIE
ncbi:MAG TPA: biotin/lipoyl-containing protein [Bryobacteraceae bacterium]|nr:biotin/lipoyl-containing protein [Bryobacteraceae bacterium]